MQHSYIQSYFLPVCSETNDRKLSSEGSLGISYSWRLAFSLSFSLIAATAWVLDLEIVIKKEGNGEETYLFIVCIK